MLMSYPDTTSESIATALDLVAKFRAGRGYGGYSGIDPIVDAAEHAGHAAMLCVNDPQGSFPLAKSLRNASERLHGVGRGLAQVGRADRLHFVCENDLDEAERLLRNVSEAF